MGNKLFLLVEEFVWLAGAFVQLDVRLGFPLEQFHRQPVHFEGYAQLWTAESCQIFYWHWIAISLLIQSKYAPEHRFLFLSQQWIFSNHHTISKSKFENLMHMTKKKIKTTPKLTLLLLLKSDGIVLWITTCRWTFDDLVILLFSMDILTPHLSLSGVNFFAMIRYG